MRFFIEEGYPTASILEYILTLANSNFEIWRRQNPAAPLSDFEFKAEKITSSNPMFDFAKLNDISKTIISKMSAEEVYNLLAEWAKEFDKEFFEVISSNPEYTKSVLNIDRETAKPRKDIAKMKDVKENVWGYMFNEYFKPIYETENTNINDLKEVVAEYGKIYNQNDTKDEWFARIKDMSARLGYAVDNKEFKANPEKFKGNVALVCEYIRIALTGRKNSPDLYSISEVLGEAEVQRRFTLLLENV